MLARVVRVYVLVMTVNASENFRFSDRLSAIFAPVSTSAAFAIKRFCRVEYEVVCAGDVSCGESSIIVSRQ